MALACVSFVFAALFPAGAADDTLAVPVMGADECVFVLTEVAVEVGCTLDAVVVFFALLTLAGTGAGFVGTLLELDDAPAGFALDADAAVTGAALDAVMVFFALLTGAGAGPGAGVGFAGALGAFDSVTIGTGLVEAGCGFDDAVVAGAGEVAVACVVGGAGAGFAATAGAAVVTEAVE